MSKATALIAKLDKALKLLGGDTGLVYKRVISKSGGDPVTGKGVVVSTTDTLLSPQPVITDISGGTVAYTAEAGKSLTDKICFVSASSMTQDETLSPGVLIVVKRGSLEEEFNIIDPVPIVFGGTAVGFDLRLRSRKR